MLVANKARVQRAASNDAERYQTSMKVSLVNDLRILQGLHYTCDLSLALDSFGSD